MKLTVFTLKCIAICTALSWQCYEDHRSIPVNIPVREVLRGLTLVAPPGPFNHDPTEEIRKVQADWIAVVPYAFTPVDKPIVLYNMHNRQWWGERPEGIRETIKLAKSAELKVFLKPQVWSRGWWTGEYEFDSDASWKNWELQYQDYIIYYARMADSLDVELFCIGTEFKSSIDRNPDFWSSLIDSVRIIYSGPIIYAANWDNYKKIPFWNKLDGVGINAYFPLTDHETPSVSVLMEKWRPYERDIRKFYKKVGKPIVFTEYGYLSVDGCAHNTWELESKIRECRVNQNAQANSFEALYRTFWNEPYWWGGFLWKWYPNGQGHEGYFDKDYTPQGKKAELILKDWYGKS